MSHVVSDIVAGVGALWDLSKSSKSMIFGLLVKKNTGFIHLKKKKTISIFPIIFDNEKSYNSISGRKTIANTQFRFFLDTRYIN